MSKDKALRELANSWINEVSVLDQDRCAEQVLAILDAPKAQEVPAPNCKGCKRPLTWEAGWYCANCGLAPVEGVGEPQPSGYAHRYADGYIRFSHGEMINGGYPIETIPYYFGPGVKTGEKK